MAADLPVVKDYLIPLEKYPHIHKSKTVADAVGVILSFTCGENERLRYSELLVIDNGDTCVGRVTLQDILYGLDKRLFDVSSVKGFEGKRSDYPDLTILWEDSFYKDCVKRGVTPVTEVMSKATARVKENDSLLKALYILLHSKEVVLPVVDGDKILGVVRLEELFKAVTSQCRL